MPQIGTYLVKGDLPAEDRIRIIRDAGFDFICIGMKAYAESEGKLPELCAKYGLPIDNIHLTGERTNFIWSEGDEGEEICERYIREITECSAAGLKKGIVHVTWGKKVTPEPPSDTGFSRYERIRETAARCGFTVCVENSIFPGHFFSVLDRFDVPEFAHCFDCGHWNAFMRDFDVPGKYSTRLAATHIHDNDGVHDLHILPFDGSADWDLIASKLASCPFSREKICSEFGGAREITFKGKNPGQIEEMLSGLACAGTGAFRAVDGAAVFYEGIPYEELIATLYGRMKKLSDMVEARIH